MTVPVTTTAEITRDKLPPGGIEGLMQTLICPHPGGRSDTERLTDTTEREFQLVGLLNKAPTFPETLAATFEGLSSSSFFKLPGDVRSADIQCPIGTIRLQANDDGVLERITATLRSTHPNEALAEFINGVTPILDHLAYQAETPVVMDRVQCTDERNGLIVVTIVSPYGMQVINPHGAELWLEMLPIYALYREAKNNPSNYYRLLCYFKILDAVFKHLRPEIRRRAREQGISITTPPERVPNHPELLAFDAHFCCQAVHDIYQDVLRNEYRNAIAHVLDDDAAPVNVSEYRTSSKFANVILLAEQCCRVVIETQEDCYRQFYRAGGKRS